MNSQSQPDYATALRAYLKDPDESALKAAYELGRAALDNGTGVTDIIGVHAEALGSILGTSQTAIWTHSISFLVECLAPLEMAHRGFMEANRPSRRSTRTLSCASGSGHASSRRPTMSSKRSPTPFPTTSGPRCGRSMGSASDPRRLRAATRRRQAESLSNGSGPTPPHGAVDRRHAPPGRVSRQKLSPGPIDLGALAEEIVGELRDQQPDRDIEIRIAERLDANADPDLMRIALTNLLSNAFKFTANRSAPRIDFASETRGDEVVYYCVTTVPDSTWPTRQAFPPVRTAAPPSRVPRHRHRPGNRATRHTQARWTGLG